MSLEGYLSTTVAGRDLAARHVLNEWVRLTDPLSERQIAILRWIAEGCAAGVVEGHTYKNTARSLHDRRLVVVTKRRGIWSAAVTDVGRYYLEHGSFPPTNGTRPSGRVVPNAGQAVAGSASHTVAGPVVKAARSAPRAGERQKHSSPTEQLVADVLAAGGHLKRPRNDNSRSYEVENLVRSANRHGKVPNGKRLVHQVVTDGGSWHGPRSDVFVLEEGPTGTDAALVPVPVPADVARYHPAVSELRKAKIHIASTASSGRAWRIMNAMAVEAQQRGFTVTSHRSRATDDRRRTAPTWHLLLTINGDTVPMRLEEENDRVEHVPTARELAEQKRNYWTRIPTHDRIPSGRLRIEIGAQSQDGRKSSWADRTSWTLEDKLPTMLREVAVRADELRLRREAKARAEAEYRAAVEREEEHARARAAETNRRKHLDQQLERWREASELRTYAAAVAERITSAQGDPAAGSVLAGAAAWLNWIEQHIERLDPLRNLPTMPEPPELSTYELHKFMQPVPEPREMHYQPTRY